MGNEKMKKLGDNVLIDFGKGLIESVYTIQKRYSVKLPLKYIDFAVAHNGASLIDDVFDYKDPNSGGRISSDSIAFIKLENVLKRVDNIKSGEEPDWDIKYKFEDGLIPFGDNGGGDLICFDYRKDRTTNDPSIVIWNHDMGFDHRVVFIANNFEEFVGMLRGEENRD